MLSQNTFRFFLSACRGGEHSPSATIDASLARRLLRAASSLGGPAGAKARANARAALRGAFGGTPADAASAARVLEWVAGLPRVSLGVVEWGGGGRGSGR